MATQQDVGKWDKVTKVPRWRHPRTIENEATLIGCGGLDGQNVHSGCSVGNSAEPRRQVGSRRRIIHHFGEIGPFSVEYRMQRMVRKGS